MFCATFSVILSSFSIIAAAIFLDVKEAVIGTFLITFDFFSTALTSSIRLSSSIENSLLGYSISASIGTSPSPTLIVRKSSSSILRSHSLESFSFIICAHSSADKYLLKRIFF